MATIASVAAPSSSSRIAGAPTDHDLVAAVRRGDDRAFETLYERYHRRIAGYIYGMVGDYGRAEDIAQDVFMSALRRMRDTDRPIAFKPWVYEIAKNACIDQFRRSRRAEEVSYDADEGLGAADYGRLVTTGPTPDVAVDQKMSLDHLCGAFGGLSETHHEILVMRELEGLSYREIGEKLGMSRPSVESTLFRARRRLSEEYEDLVSGDRCRRVQAIILTAADGALGARDQRSMARHISYCQPCRRQAKLSGVDVAVLSRKPVRARIAAFLPLPAFLRDRWLPGHGGSEAGGLASGVSQQAGTLAQWSANLGTHLDPSMTGWARAAAAAATLAVAGVGAGVATQRQDVSLSGALPGSVAAKKASSAALPAPRAIQAAATSATGSSTSAPLSQAQAGRRAAAKKGAAGTTTKPSTTSGTTVTGSLPAGAPQSGAAAPAADQGGVMEQLNKATQPLTSGGSANGTGSAPSSGTSTPTPLPGVPDPTTVVPDVAAGAGAPPLPGADKATQDAGDAVKGVTDAVSGALGG
jgi:RNA polymerase sigma factor (sigma-70 family)